MKRLNFGIVLAVLVALIVIVGIAPKPRDVSADFIATTTQYNIYRQTGDWYIRYINPQNSTVWDDTTSSMSTTAAWSNTAITLTYNSVLGCITINPPDGLPNGYYDACLYNSSTPLVTDTIQSGSKVLYIRKSKILKILEL